METISLWISYARILLLLLFNNADSYNLRPVSGIISFGDSYLDAGINNYLPLAAPGDRCNHLPYGRIFDTMMLTGRFTDGELITDMIAKFYGIPFALPYLHPNATGVNLFNGANFASGGAGLLESTSDTQGVASMSLQIIWFKDYKRKLVNLLGNCQTQQFLVDALVFISVGSNDYAYKSINPTESNTDHTVFTQKMISNYTSYLKEIYAIGARRFVILSLLPLGCIPSSITFHGDPISRDCVASLNALTVNFNSKLQNAINNLILPGAKLIFVDAYSTTLDIVQNPSKYGFTVTKKGCCGTGLVEFGLSCNETVEVCSDASEYVYFDAAHGSSATYKFIAQQVQALLHQQDLKFTI